MSLPRFIDKALLEAVVAQAQASPRRRRNFNFHAHETQPSHRLLNAIEPGSYIQPHRHLDPNKDETIVALRGRLGVVFFDDTGEITATAVLTPGGPCIGVDIAHGTWHTLLAIEPGTVMLEAKGGPYLPLAAQERAPWAPAEGETGAAEYLGSLARRIS